MTYIANIYSKTKRKSIFHAVLKADKTSTFSLDTKASVPSSTSLSWGDGLAVLHFVESADVRQSLKHSHYKHSHGSGPWYICICLPKTSTTTAALVNPLAGFVWFFFFLFQWKHPYDSLSCLILDTFSFCLSPVANKRPQYEKGHWSE
jgi:hypothetical protein